MTQLVRVRVSASAKKESSIEIGDNSFAISVKEPAEDNRANDRVREILAANLGVPLNRVRLQAGHHKPAKRFEILPASHL